MLSREEQRKIMERIEEFFRECPGVKGLALVGSRGRGTNVDQFSDADYLVCVEEASLAEMMKATWINEIADPVIVFPLVLPNQVRVFFKDFFDCDFHFYTPKELAQAQGECPLGTYVAAGFRILSDPFGYLKEMYSRVIPLDDDVNEGDPAITASVFWFNMACTAKQILRGDLFRAYRFSNWWLQQMLLAIMEPRTPIPGDKLKNLKDRLKPDYYKMLQGSFVPMEKGSMVKGLVKLADCFWVIQKNVLPQLDDTKLGEYQEIDRFVRSLEMK